MIAAGETISAAITEPGPQQTRLFTWGGGAHGALGHDDEEDVYSPKVVEAVDNDNIIKQQIVWYETSRKLPICARILSLDCARCLV